MKQLIFNFASCRTTPVLYFIYSMGVIRAQICDAYIEITTEFYDKPFARILYYFRVNPVRNAVPFWG